MTKTHRVDVFIHGRGNIQKLEAAGRSTGPHNLSIEQSIAIIDKHVKDNPQDWNKPMSLMVFSVLYTTCKSSNP